MAHLQYGQIEIIGVFITLLDTAGSIQKMVSSFKLHNSV